MLFGDNTRLRRVHGFDESELRSMRIFLQGSVRTWCRDRKNQSFRASDLLGGANVNWQGTPLQPLFDHYFERGHGDETYAIRQAGIAAGYLLKQVLARSNRRYRTEKGYTRMYRWID